uniref:Uncharacterized protein n=1 Tax=Anguilla anguilla TaxID=7936 RepID=A0A0E9WVA1_ANGAN
METCNNGHVFHNFICICIIYVFRIFSHFINSSLCYEYTLANIFSNNSMSTL